GPAGRAVPARGPGRRPRRVPHRQPPERPHGRALPTLGDRRYAALRGVSGRFPAHLYLPDEAERVRAGALRDARQRRSTVSLAVQPRGPPVVPEVLLLPGAARAGAGAAQRRRAPELPA